MDTQKEFDELIAKASSLRKRKNKDYGDGFLDGYGNQTPINSTRGNLGIYFDIHRKVGRLDKFLLTNCKNEVADETIDDTLIDLAVICLNAAIVMQRQRKGKKEKGW